LFWNTNGTKWNVGSSTVHLGRGAQATGSNSVAIGSSSLATGSSSVAIGNSSSAAGIYSTAIGTNASAVGTYSTAIGTNASASQNNTITLNAAGGVLNPANSGFYVNPVRNVTSSNMVYYTPATSEISYGAVSTDTTIAHLQSQITELNYNLYGLLVQQFGTTWTEILPIPALGAVQTNGVRFRQVAITIYNINNLTSLFIDSKAVTYVASGSPDYVTQCLFAIIPPYQTYYVSSGGTIQRWYELR
jgi:hypothetical protein